MQTFKGFVLSTFLLLLGIVSLGEASAQGFGFGTGHSHNGGSYGFEQDRSEEIVETVSRYVDGDTSLPLRQIFDLGQEDRGTKIIKIEVFASSSSRFATAQLEINGSLVGYEQDVSWRYDNSVVLDVPFGERTLGQDIRTLKLRLQGSMYVDKIVATIKKRSQGGGHGNPRSEWVTSFDRERFVSVIPVKQALRLNRQHEGKELKTLILKGNPMGQRVTSMQLMVDGRRVGAPQYLDRQNGQVTFALAQRDTVQIQQGDSIKIVFDGQVMVNELAAELVKSNELRINVHERVGAQRIFLDQLLRLDYATAAKKFEKIIIKGQLAGRNSSIRACARGFYQGAACDSAVASSGSFEIELDKFEMQAADIFLMARGEALITEVILVEDKRSQDQYPW